MLTDLLYRLRAVFRRKTIEEELDEELRFHFEREAEKQMNSGLAREEALRRARLAFGGLDQVKEECRQARGVSALETTVQDLRYAIRGMRRSPGGEERAGLSGRNRGGRRRSEADGSKGADAFQEVAPLSVVFVFVAGIDVHVVII